MQIIELERRAAAQGTAIRGSAFSSWANLDIAPEDMYFLDSHGDRNNLVYGGLYRADVAAYHRADPCGVAKGAMHHGGRHLQRYMYTISLNSLPQLCLAIPAAIPPPSLPRVQTHSHAELRVDPITPHPSPHDPFLSCGQHGNELGPGGAHPLPHFQPCS